MNELVTVETWLVIMTAALIALGAAAIRLGWRRGKGMEDS
jgi:hypothetical protein